MIWSLSKIPYKAITQSFARSRMTWGETHIIAWLSHLCQATFLFFLFILPIIMLSVHWWIMTGGSPQLNSPLNGQRRRSALDYRSIVADKRCFFVQWFASLYLGVFYWGRERSKNQLFYLFIPFGLVLIISHAPVGSNGGGFNRIITFWLQRSLNKTLSWLIHQGHGPSTRVIFKHRLFTN